MYRNKHRHRDEARRYLPNDSSMNKKRAIHKETTRNEIRGIHRETPRNEIRDILRETPRKEIRGIQRETPRKETRDIQRETHRNEIRDIQRETPRNEIRGIQRETPRNEIRGIQRETHRNEIRGIQRETPRKEIRDIHRETHRNEIRDIQREIPRYEMHSTYGESPRNEIFGIHGEIPRNEIPSIHGEIPRNEIPSIHGEIPTYEMHSIHEELPRNEILGIHGEIPRNEIPSIYGESPRYGMHSIHGEIPRYEMHSIHEESPRNEIPSIHGEIPNNEIPSIYGETPRNEIPSIHGETSRYEMHNIHGESPRNENQIELIEYNCRDDEKVSRLYTQTHKFDDINLIDHFTEQDKLVLQNTLNFQRVFRPPGFGKLPSANLEVTYDRYQSDIVDMPNPYLSQHVELKYDAESSDNGYCSPEPCIMEIDSEEEIYVKSESLAPSYNDSSLHNSYGGFPVQRKHLSVMDRLDSQRNGNGRFPNTNNRSISNEIYDEFQKKRYSPYSKDRNDSPLRRQKSYSRSPTIAVKKESYDDSLFYDDDNRTSKKNGSYAGSSKRNVDVKPEGRYILHVSITTAGCFTLKKADKLAELFHVDVHFQDEKSGRWIFCLNNKTQFDRMVINLYHHRIIDKEILLDYDDQLEIEERTAPENMSPIFRNLIPTSEGVLSLIPKVVKEKVLKGDRLVRGLNHSLVWFIKAIHAAAYRRRNETGIQTLLVTLSPVNHVFYKQLDVIAKFFKLNLYSPASGEPFDYDKAAKAQILLTSSSAAVNTLKACNFSNLSTIMIDDISSIINRNKNESVFIAFMKKLSSLPSYGSISKVVTIRRNCPSSKVFKINEIMNTEFEDVSVSPNMSSTEDMEIEPQSIKQERIEIPDDLIETSPARSNKDDNQPKKSSSTSSKFNNKLLTVLSRNNMTRLTTSSTAKVIDAEFLLNITAENLVDNNVPKSIMLKLYEVLLLIKENKHLLPPTC